MSNRLLLSYPNKKKPLDYYTAYKSKKNSEEKERTMSFFEYYILVDCIRDHTNHASNRGSIYLEDDSCCGKFLAEFKCDHNDIMGFLENEPGGYIGNIMKNKDLIKRILYKAIDLYNSLGESDKNLDIN